MNAFLAAGDFVGGESLFSFVFVGKSAIEITTFERSKQLDFFGAASLPIDNQLPAGFTSRNCANGEIAALAKFEFRDRTYVVLGEAR